MKGELVDAMTRYIARVEAATEDLPANEEAARTAARAVLSGFDLEFGELSGIMEAVSQRVAAQPEIEPASACVSGLHIGLTVGLLVAEQRGRSG